MEVLPTAPFVIEQPAAMVANTTGHSLDARVLALIKLGISRVVILGPLLAYVLIRSTIDQKQP